MNINRLTIRNYGLLIFGFSFVFSALRTYFGIYLTTDLIALTVLTHIVKKISNTTYIRSCCYIFSLYPLLVFVSVFTTWLFACYYLGHPPGPYFDDPMFIKNSVAILFNLTSMLILGLLPMILLCVIFNLLELIAELSKENPKRIAIVHLVFLPIISWFVFGLILAVNPANAIAWFAA